MELTQEYLKSILKYDLLTGDFVWRESKGAAKKGNVAGNVCMLGSKKYIRIKLNYKLYLAHRLAFLYILSAFPEDQTDHINGNGLDNRWINLRPVSISENHRNMRLSSRNKSGSIGVHWDKNANKWLSNIRVNNKTIHLGYFLDINDAIVARKEAEVKYNFHQNHGQARSL